ncbi:hypothetical protein Gohar_004120, partial [Gossypium harknessii]|nr:hypothetical protein [Gossypium harknessii]
MDLIATSIAWARSISNSVRVNNSCCSDYTKEYWQPPRVGWVKVNIDGSVPKHTSSAAVGGVIRVHKGNWLFGFGLRIDRSGIFQTEARALYEGLVVAWHERFRQIEVESDNPILIDVHILRGQNKVADCIAKMSNGDLNVKCYFVEPRKGVRNLLKN